MKKFLVFILTVSIVLIASACNQTIDKNPDLKKESEQPTISTSVLDEALSNSKYYCDPFSISVGKLVNSAMDSYKITYLTGKEAIEKGYLSESEIDESVNLDYLYYAIISGDTMVNPDIPYMTEYEDEAAKVWMVFDEKENFLTSGVSLCENLSTCAIIIMTSSY